MPAEQTDFDDESPRPGPNLWEENHGNFLLAVMAAIFLLGGIILVYRQMRFVKPRFPDGSAIVQADASLEADAANVPSDATLTITILGAGNENGAIMLAVYGSEPTFNDPKQAMIKEALPIKDGRSVLKIPLPDLPAKFAVAAFHDENGNGTLDRTSFGIPSERYGFSQDARRFRGPPSYQEALTTRPTADATIEISIR